MASNPWPSTSAATFEAHKARVIVSRNVSGDHPKGCSVFDKPPYICRKMPTDVARAHQDGAPEANRQKPERHISDGTGVP
jgi:hypothetical protein